MPKIILEERKKYYLDYKKNNNKESLQKLILTFIPIIENIIKKYDNNIEHDEMLSISVEEAITTINKYQINDDVRKIGLYINQRINTRLQFELSKQKHISYEEYFKTRKNGEDGYYIDNETNHLIDCISLKKVFDILSDQQKRILILRYGLFNNSQLTNEAIGELLGISKQGVHIHQQDAIKKLQRKHIVENLKK